MSAKDWRKPFAFVRTGCDMNVRDWYGAFGFWEVWELFVDGSIRRLQGSFKTSVASEIFQEYV